MPSVGAGCHELRIPDERVSWRIMYRLDGDAVIILAVFQKTTRKTPRRLIAAAQRRLTLYDAALDENDHG